MEGQGLTNQRTEPHKSLISKNVRHLNVISTQSQPFQLIFKFILFIEVHVLLISFLFPDFEDEAADAEGGLGVL